MQRRFVLVVLNHLDRTQSIIHRGELELQPDAKKSRDEYFDIGTISDITNTYAGYVDSQEYITFRLLLLNI